MCLREFNKEIRVGFHMEEFTGENISFQLTKILCSLMVKCTMHMEVQRRDVVSLAPRLAKTLASEKAVCVLSGYSHIRLCHSMDCSLPGSPVHGILQARTLEWVAMVSSGASSQPRNRIHVSRIPHWQASSLPLVPPGKPHIRKVFKSKNRYYEKT